MITKDQAREIKKSVLKCLTEEFEYGKRKDGKPLKRKKVNQPLFDKHNECTAYHDGFCGTSFPGKNTKCLCHKYELRKVKQ